MAAAVDFTLVKRSRLPAQPGYEFLLASLYHVPGGGAPGCHGTLVAKRAAADDFVLLHTMSAADLEGIEVVFCLSDDYDAAEENEWGDEFVATTIKKIRVPRRLRERWALYETPVERALLDWLDAEAPAVEAGLAPPPAM